MSLADQIIEHGPVVPGEVYGAAILASMCDSEMFNELRDELIAARKLREVLTALLDTDGCEDFDHHGQCQTHFAGTVDGQCAQARAKELLAELVQRATEHTEVCR